MYPDISIEFSNLPLARIDAGGWSRLLPSAHVFPLVPQYEMPLLWTATNGHEEVVKSLLGQDDINVNAKEIIWWLPTRTREW
jgi:hypothetical protein